jgi:predicted TPR repeat methyltransferase
VKTKSDHNLMAETLPLLREASQVMRAKSETSVALKIDEAVAKLEALMQADLVDHGSINEVLKILGQGLALIPAIAQLLQMFKD